MKRYPTSLCEACGKHRYATREAAEAVAAHIAATSTSDTVPIRAYECHAGWWHLTSRTVDEHRDRIMTRRDIA